MECGLFKAEDAVEFVDYGEGFFLGEVTVGILEFCELGACLGTGLAIFLEMKSFATEACDGVNQIEVLVRMVV